MTAPQLRRIVRLGFVAPALTGAFLACGGGSGGSLGNVPTASYPVDASVLARAAVVIGSCAPDDRPNGFLKSWYVKVHPVADLENRILGAAECLATHGGGCAAMKACLGIEVDQTGPCADGCSGSVATTCDGTLKFRIDCARIGQTCDQGECVASGGAACDGATFQSTCDGGRPNLCSAGKVALGPICKDLGLTCVTTPGAYGARCAGTGAACNAGSFGTLTVDWSNGVGCEGAKLRTCVAGTEALLDCGTIAAGFTCQSVGTSFFCGKAAECDALGMKWKETCDGDSVVTCNGGKTEKVACTSLGFAGCNSQFGVCTPSPW